MVDVSKFLEKAEDAVRKKNYEYAIRILKDDILPVSPDNVKARRLLRGTELEKFKATSYPNPAQAMMKGLVPFIKMNIAKMTKKWETVMREAENFLQHDPKNIGVNHALGEAAVQAGYIETGIASFETILTFDANHLKTLKALGRVYRHQKVDLDKAKQYYQRAYRVDSGDFESAKELKAIDADKTSKTYSEAESSKDLIKDKDKAKELEEKQSLLRTDDDYLRAIERTKAKLVEDPNNKKELRYLGDLYLGSGKLEEAVTTLEKVLELDPTSLDIRNKIGDCRIKKCEMKVNDLQQRFKKFPKDGDLERQLKMAMKEKADTEIKEYDARVKAQPTNYTYRFTLGMALARANRYDEAIGNFQHSIKDPQNRTESYVQMGIAFMKKKDFNLAINQLNNAMGSLSPKDPKFQDVQYYLGQAYEAASEKEKAIEIYTKIYETDIQFRDVAERLKKLKG